MAGSDDSRGTAPSWTGRASRSPDAEPIYQVWPCDGLPEGAWVRLEALDERLGGHGSRPLESAVSDALAEK